MYTYHPVPTNLESDDERGLALDDEGHVVYDAVHGDALIDDHRTDPLHVDELQHTPTGGRSGGVEAWTRHPTDVALTPLPSQLAYLTLFRPVRIGLGQLHAQLLDDQQGLCLGEPQHRSTDRRGYASTERHRSPSTRTCGDTALGDEPDGEEHHTHGDLTGSHGSRRMLHATTPHCHVSLRDEDLWQMNAESHGSAGSLGPSLPPMEDTGRPAPLPRGPCGQAAHPKTEVAYKLDNSANS